MNDLKVAEGDVVKIKEAWGSYQEKVVRQFWFALDAE